MKNKENFIEFLKKNEEEILDLFYKNNLTDKEIIEKEEEIKWFLEKKKNNDYKFYISIDEDKNLIEFFKKEEKEEFINNIKKNFLYNNCSLENMFEISLTNKIIKNNSRKPIFSLFKKLIDGSELSKTNVWIKGDFGVGKTYLSIALLNFFATQNKKVSFIFLPEFITEVNSNLMKSDFNVFSLIEKFKKSKVLVIDDIGSEKMSNWFRDNVFFPILNSRVSLERITVFTSNISINDYKKLLIKEENKYIKNKDFIDDLKNERIINRIEKYSFELEILKVNNS